MKSLSLFLLFILTVAFSALGQERTDETRITVNPETGDTTVTESIVVSITEDITPRSHIIIINPLKFLLF
ncbi:MAG: hypothetical protein IH795_01545 [Bacteroidetes bacterium]|nr:hypothetical protein [Bacteroidota bacterium]